MRKTSIHRCVIPVVVALVVTLTPAVNAAEIGYVTADGLYDQSFDIGWTARLGLQGHTVTGFGQGTSADDATLATMDLLIVSSDVSSGSFLSGIGLNQPQPILTFEYGLYDDIFGGGSGNTTGSGADITISEPSSPWAAGLSGQVTTYTGGPGSGSRVNSPHSAGTQVVASNTSVEGNVLLVLDAGALGAGDAIYASVRVAVPAYADWDPAAVTADGWTLLDNAVDYALIPEPSTFALIGLGMLAFIARRRMR